MRRVPVLVIAVSLFLTACGVTDGATDGVVPGAGPALGTGPTTTLTPNPVIDVIEPDGELVGLTATLIAEGFARPADARSPIGDDRIFEGLRRRNKRA